jgi:prepilin-type N-terminal cleavage/methylation domain-containing protein
MPTSAELPRDRARAGFTLLEILVTLAVVSLAIVSLLGVRDASWNMAYRSGHMMRAASYAEELLAQHLINPETLDEYQGVVEDDPIYRYELTIEDYDLSTGRVEEPEDQDGFSQASNFSSTSAFTPPDAYTPEDDEAADDPYRVRRFRVRISYPSLSGDGDDEYVLEGYAPRATEQEPGAGESDS